MSRKILSHFTAQFDNSEVELQWYRYDVKSNIEYFRIYRRETDDFEFNACYEEFFSDEYPEDKDLIFKGKLIPESGDRKYVFTDKHVEVGKTYAYFVAAEETPLLGPMPVKVRDPEVWWSYDTLKTRINKMREEFPEAVTVFSCGMTVEGREILSLQLGRGKVALGLTGALHPGESGPELIVSALHNLLRQSPELFVHKSIVAIPSICIDSREKLVKGVPWYLRRNSAGVDLNRNFPEAWETVNYGYGLDTSDHLSQTYRGPYPASEPETRALIDFFSKFRPACTICCHALACICDIPCVAPGGIDAADRKFYEETEKFLLTYGRAMHPELKPVPEWINYAGFAGSFGNWLYNKLGCISFDLEAGVDKNALNACRKDATDRKLLNSYIEKHTRGIRAVMEL